MLFYFTVFIVIGLGLGKFVANKKVALALIIVLSIFWGLSHKEIWGLVTLGELLLGYFLFDVLLRAKEEVIIGESNHDKKI